MTGRGTLSAKLQAAESAYRLRAEDVVATSTDVTERKRLEIYASGYVLRLMECLRADFPCLLAWLGPSVFDAFAKAYLVVQPPGSYTLFDLSARFPAFLAATQPASVGQSGSALLDLPVDMARMERAMVEVLRAPGLEASWTHPPAGTPDGLLAGEALVQASPCLRLLTLRFPLLDFLAALADGRRHDVPPPVFSRVALGRRDYSLTAAEIEGWQFAFLEACREPTSMSVATARAAEATGQPPGELAAQILLWVPVALDQGWLTYAPSE